MKAQLLGFWDKGRIVCVCGCSLLGGLSPSSFTEQLQLPPCRLLHIPASTCSANTAPQSYCKTLKFNFKWLQPVSSSHCKVITFFFWLFCFLRNNLKKKSFKLSFFVSWKYCGWGFMLLFFSCWQLGDLWNTTSSTKHLSSDSLR